MKEHERTLNPQELKTLGDYLEEKQDVILNEWESRIKYNKNEKGKQASALASWSQDKFYNSIPNFLQYVCRRFHGEKTSRKHPAEAHGVQRWEHGFDLRELINEWSILHLVLIKQINQAPNVISINTKTLAKGHQKLATYIHEGILLSVEKYYSLHRNRAESQLRDLESVVQEHSVLTEQRGQNLQQASHDLKGSMTALRMNLALLEKADLGDKATQLVTKLSTASESLTKMLENLLDLSRLEAGREERKVSEFDAAETLRSLCERLQPTANDANLELRCRGDDPLPVRGDQLKVQRIAQNLLLNALKYTREGYVELTWGSDSPEIWVLTVRDTGPGMEATHAAPFSNTSTEPKSAGQSSGSDKNQRADEVQMHGEGIGLSIVRQLCNLLDAVLEIESEPGVGTTIQVSLPRNYTRV